tara:strand:+ start:21 stop:287 length:267 start_codon:yes stop_codon:yes gene_type:complete
MNLEVLGVIEKYGVTVVSLVVCAYFLYKVVMFSLVKAVEDFKEEHVKNREAISKIGDMVNSMADKHEDFVGNFKTFREVITDLVKEKK